MGEVKKKKPKVKKKYSDRKKRNNNKEPSVTHCYKDTVSMGYAHFINLQKNKKEQKEKQN